MSDVAAATTAVGRTMLLRLKEFAETQRGGDVIYGDSVAGYTPVVVRLAGGRATMMTVDSVAHKVGRDAWVPCRGPGRGDKDAIELSRRGVDIWSDAGWTRVHRLIRHRLAPHKRMVRVTTRTGMVDVTDDHSLLRPDGSVVGPGDLAPGERLLHADLPVGELLRGTDAERLQAWRAIFVEGYRSVDSGDQLHAARIFALGASLGRAVTISAAPAGRIRIHVTDSSPAEGDKDRVLEVTELHVSEAEPYVYDFTTDSAHFSAGVGRIVVHNTDSCFMTFPGRCRGLVGPAALQATIDAAKECSDEFRKHIPPPQNAEYEKTFWPFILISKKRYVGNKYEDDAEASPVQTSMGLVLKRRDNAPIVKHVYGGVIDRLLNGADVDGAAAFVRERMEELVAGRVPVSDLVVSKNLGGEYADPDRIAHAVLARRMAERDPGSAPSVGDRVPYVYVVPPGGHAKGTLQGDRIEHPDHLAGAAVDYAHYITNQVQKPVVQLFALMVTRLAGCRVSDEALEKRAQIFLNECEGDLERARKKLDAVKAEEVSRLIFGPCLAACERRRLGVRDITSFCDKTTLARTP